MHIEGLRRAGVHVEGVLGSSLERSQQCAQQLSIPKGYSSLEELLSDAAVDVVHITTPIAFTLNKPRAVWQQVNMCSAKSHWRELQRVEQTSRIGQAIGLGRRRQLQHSLLSALY